MALPIFIINKGYDDEQRVEGATRYATVGDFIDFMNDPLGQQILRIRASLVYNVEMLQVDN